MIRLHRLPYAIALSLLLVGMQLGSELHALGHISEALRQPVNHSVGAPEDDACALCVLFAGGANALAGDIDLAITGFVNQEFSPHAPAFLARAAPSFYDSRAPPAFL